MKFLGQSQGHFFFSHSTFMNTDTGIFTSMSCILVSTRWCSEAQCHIQRDLLWDGTLSLGRSSQWVWSPSHRSFLITLTAGLLAYCRQTADPVRSGLPSILSIINRMSEKKRSAKDCLPRGFMQQMESQEITAFKGFKNLSIDNWTHFNLMSCPC